MIKCFEETSLNVRLTGVAGAVEASLPGLRLVLLVLEAHARATRITLSQEHDAYRWVPLAQVNALKLRPAFGTIFANYLNSSSLRNKPRPTL